MDLLIATRNTHKTEEFASILGTDFTVRDLRSLPEAPEVEETGMSFEENAILKALAASVRTPTLVVADDSGLEVDALGGAPGVRSARYAGDGATDTQNIVKVLAGLRQIRAAANATARFRCVLALAQNGGILATFHGSTEGAIVEPPRGENGFGYDPVFVPAGRELTFAQLGPVEKNQVSHRRRAIDQLRLHLSRVT